MLCVFACVCVSVRVFTVYCLCVSVCLFAMGHDAWNKVIWFDLIWYCYVYVGDRTYLPLWTQSLHWAVLSYATILQSSNIVLAEAESDDTWCRKLKWFDWRFAAGAMRQRLLTASVLASCQSHNMAAHTRRPWCVAVYGSTCVGHLTETVLPLALPVTWVVVLVVCLLVQHQDSNVCSMRPLAGPSAYHVPPRRRSLLPVLVHETTHLKFCLILDYHSHKVLSGLIRYVKNSVLLNVYYLLHFYTLRVTLTRLTNV